MDMIDQAYETLREAILLQAIRDYKRAVKRCCEYEKSYIEKFFLSEWGQQLSEERGNLIIEICIEQAKAEPKRGKRGVRDIRA